MNLHKKISGTDKRKSGETGTGLPLLYTGTNDDHCSLKRMRRSQSRMIRKSGYFYQRAD